MRVVYRVPVPAITVHQQLEPDSAAFHWQQFFAPHAGVSFLVEVIDSVDGQEWGEGDWLVVNEALPLRNGAIVVTHEDDELWLRRYTRYLSVPALETLSGQHLTADLNNVTILGTAVHQVRQLAS